jgi:GH15 family glucan-1,4-alpha-glucosidase
MHTTICELGFDSDRNSFTQSFGSSELDASLLLIPLVGFLPAPMAVRKRAAKSR